MGKDQVKYHVFVAVGVEDTGEPSSGVMQVIETLPSVARDRGIYRKCKRYSAGH